jgi:hypothetical protein
MAASCERGGLHDYVWLPADYFDLYSWVRNVPENAKRRIRKILEIEFRYLPSKTIGRQAQLGVVLYQ